MVVRFASLSLTLFLFASCDPERKKKCEWYLMPDVDKVGQAQPGFIRVCARNFVNNKQDCRLQSTMDFAKTHFEKKFRYVDMEVDGVGIPRAVKSISHCN